MSIPVSVIIPIHNVAGYLSSCLDSVLSQSLAAVEVICIDDCSHDNSLEILQKYSEKDNRLRYICLDNNKGQAAVRNIGLAEAEGEYIYFIDPDDLLFSSESLEHLYSIAKVEKADEVIGAMLRWNETTEERRYGYHTNFLKSRLSAVKFREHQYLKSNVTGCNKLIRSSFLSDNGIVFNEQLRKFEDNPFSWKVHLLARSISLTLKPTYLHRQRKSNVPMSIMQCKEHDFIEHVKAAHDMLDFLDAHVEYADLRNIFDNYFFCWLFVDAEVIDKNGADAEQKKEILDAYMTVFKRIPENSTRCLPHRYKEILSLMHGQEIEKIWQALILDHDIVPADFEEIKEMKQKLADIYTSTSWRITAPLRKICNFFKMLA